MLKQNITKNKRVDKILKLNAGNSKKYKERAIWDSAAYANNLEVGHLPGLYYLVV